MTLLALKEWLVVAIWTASIIFCAWIPKQDDFLLLLSTLMLSFGSYFYLCARASKINLKYLITVAILARILIIPTFPNLSDDIFRFIWDGRLWNVQLNPYLYLPSEIVGQFDSLDQSLFDQLNSQNYFSIYPPIPQFIFWFTTSISSGSIYLASSAMKFIHVIFDVGSLLLIWKLLGRFRIPQSRILLYALNPLIIIELIGNLHHEGLVIFFLLLTLWFLSGKKILFAGASMAAAIATKILPLLFCPLIFFYLKGRQRWIFFIVTISSSLLFFFPILSEPQIFQNILSSADLYLRKFEFNASAYYLYRGLGYLVYGYNLIHVLGPVLMMMTACFIFYIAIFKGTQIKKEIQIIPLLILTYCSYILLSVTVHPWYIAILIPLCLFTRFRSPLVWSGLIMFTYINYSFNPYQELLTVVFIEYSIVLAYLIYELRSLNRLKADSSKL